MGQYFKDLDEMLAPDPARPPLKPQVRDYLQKKYFNDDGLVEPGNIDLNNRPVVRNDDGSISTVRSFSANIDGNEVLLPSVSDDGRIVSEDDAIQNYLNTGKHLGKFRTPDQATAYAKKLHEDQARLYADKLPANEKMATGQFSVAPDAFRNNAPKTQAQSDLDAYRAARKADSEDESWRQGVAVAADAGLSALGRRDPNFVERISVPGSRTKKLVEDMGFDDSLAKRDYQRQLTDRTSDVSKSYHDLVAELLPNMASVVKNMSAAQIAERLPILEKVYEARQKTEAAKAKAQEDAQQMALWRKTMESRYPREVAALRKEAPGVWENLSPKTAQDLQNGWEADLTRDNNLHVEEVKSAEAANRAAGIRAGEKADAERVRTENKVVELSKALPADYEDFGKKYQTIKGLVASGKGDIPGVGEFDSRLPNWMQSNAGIKLKKEAMQLNLAYQHLITGAGASDKERQQLAQATTDMENEQSFLAGLESLKNLYDSKVRQIRAGFSDEVLKQYDANRKREQGPQPWRPKTGRQVQE